MARKSEWKDATITARVTKEEKEKIKKRAEKEGKSASQYMTDAALAGMERRSSKDMKRVRILINYVKRLMNWRRRKINYGNACNDEKREIYKS